MIILKLSTWALGFSLFIFVGCATRFEIASDYEDVNERHSYSSSGRTVIVFLVDGLPLSTLGNEISQKKLPAIQDFFMGNQKQFYMARTTFPSLTYPGVTSLLTEVPVDEHQVLGNIVSERGKEINFESYTNFPKLNSMIRGQNIFSRLKTKGERTVSLDFAFHADSTIHTTTKDLDSGFSILEKDYRYVDEKLIESLQILLTKNNPAQWPDFIFVHLIGVDLTSHDHGPNSPQVLSYLEFLDSSLQPTLDLLKKAETNHQRQLVSLLTADHGFDEKISRFVDLESALKKLDCHISILNESRFASIFFPPGYDEAKRSAILSHIESYPDMDIVAHLDGDKVFVQGKEISTTILYNHESGCEDSDFKISALTSTSFSIPASFTPFNCPATLDTNTNQLYYPYFLADLSHYFAARLHPDAVVIPKPGVSLQQRFKGQHGGPTPQEIFVPLLIRNGTLDTTHGVPTLSTLLKFI